MKQDYNQPVSETENPVSTLINTLILAIFNVVLGSHTTDKTLSIVEPAIVPMFYTFQALETVNMALQNRKEIQKVIKREGVTNQEAINLFMMALNTATYFIAIEGGQLINPVLEGYAPVIFSASLTINAAYNGYIYYRSNSENKTLSPVVLQGGLVPIVYFTLSKFAASNRLGGVKIANIGGFFGFLWTGSFIAKNVLPLNDANSLGGQIINGLARIGQVTNGLFGGTVRRFTGRQDPAKLPININGTDGHFYRTI